MTATFNPDLSNDISKVRQYLGDTDTARPQIQDETITAYRATLSILRTAEQLANDLAAKYARMADVNVDDQLTKASHLMAHFTALAARLGATAAAAELAAATTDAAAAYPGIVVAGIGDCRGPLDDCGLASYTCPTC